MFPPCYYHSWLMQIYFNASALHILYIISRISRAIDLQIYSENFRRFPCRFPVVSDGFWRFPVVILGYPWLSLVIFGYLWLSLVILGYTWLSTIQIYVKSFAHLQLFFPSFAEIFCIRGQIKWPWGNQVEPGITKYNQGKPQGHDHNWTQFF